MLILRSILPTESGGCAWKHESVFVDVDGPFSDYGSNASVVPYNSLLDGFPECYSDSRYGSATQARLHMSRYNISQDLYPRTSSDGCTQSSDFNGIIHSSDGCIRSNWMTQYSCN